MYDDQIILIFHILSFQLCEYTPLTIFPRCRCHGARDLFLLARSDGPFVDTRGFRWAAACGRGLVHASAIDIDDDDNDNDDDSNTDFGDK